MIIHDVEQRSPQWFALKIGRATASSFDKIITTKGEASKQAEKLMLKIAGESITGVPEDTYQNQAMLRGCEMESEARKFYQFMTGNKVEEVGFCTTDDKSCGCSPDALVNKNGLLEIKCPSIAVHVEYLLKNKLPTTYFQQVQGQLYVCEKEYCDFFSYYPGLRPLLIKVERDEEFIKKLAVEIKLFNANLQETINKIK